jgi:hypothetical protein
MSILWEYIKVLPRPWPPASEDVPLSGVPADGALGMSAATSPWNLLCPAGTVFNRADEGWQRLRRLATGTRVAVSDDRLGSRWRLRRLARRGRLVVERELILLPSSTQPVAVVDDTPSAVSHFWRSVATVPPGLAFTALPAAALLSLVRRLPWSWTGAIVPGRVLIGRRT